MLDKILFFVLCTLELMYLKTTFGYLRDEREKYAWIMLIMFSISAVALAWMGYGWANGGTLDGSGLMPAMAVMYIGMFFETKHKNETKKSDYVSFVLYGAFLVLFLVLTYM